MWDRLSIVVFLILLVSIAAVVCVFVREFQEVKRAALRQRTVKERFDKII